MFLGRKPEIWRKLKDCVESSNFTDIYTYFYFPYTVPDFLLNNAKENSKDSNSEKLNEN